MSQDPPSVIGHHLPPEMDLFYPIIFFIKSQ